MRTIGGRRIGRPRFAQIGGATRLRRKEKGMSALLGHGRGSSAVRKPTAAANRPCPSCERGAEFHLHCQVCRAPLEANTSKKVCPGDCRKILSHERRRSRSVRCRVSLVDHPSKTFIRWLPRKFVMPTDIAMSKPSGAHRAILREDSGRKPHRSPNG